MHCFLEYMVNSWVLDRPAQPSFAKATELQPMPPQEGWIFPMSVMLLIMTYQSFIIHISSELTEQEELTKKGLLLLLSTKILRGGLYSRITPIFRL